MDAFVIADHLRFGRIAKEVYMDDYRYKALQTLTRAKFDVIQNLTREKQRFANYLFLKCSGMAQDKDIPNFSATTIALMERFETVDDLAYAGLEEMTEPLSPSLAVEGSLTRMLRQKRYRRPPKVPTDYPRR